LTTSQNTSAVISASYAAECADLSSNSRPAAFTARDNTVCPKATPQSVAVSKLENGVAHQDGPRAVRLADGAPHFAEHALQGVPLVDRRPQGMIGIDAVDRERCRVHVGALERLDVIPKRLVSAQLAVVVELQQHGGDLQQCVRAGIEAAGFDVHYDGQEAAEAVRH
jgi:hypothetical protein